jgi:hypothetical protein
MRIIKSPKLAKFICGRFYGGLNVQKLLIPLWVVKFETVMNVEIKISVQSFQLGVAIYWGTIMNN